MPSKQEGKPIPRGLQPEQAREKAGLYNPANRNKAGRPLGSVNRYIGYACRQPAAELAEHRARLLPFLLPS
jgi:hypothetical protein